jgi:hypothetical protein
MNETVIYLTILFLLIFIVIGIFYVLTLYRTMKSITPVNRKIEPGQVWLMFIPIFNLYWSFVVVSKLSNSIASEIRYRTDRLETRPAYASGIIFSSAWGINSLLNLFGDNALTTVVGGFIALVCIVCWLIHWVQIAQYKRMIEQLPESNSDSMIFNQPL